MESDENKPKVDSPPESSRKKRSRGLLVEVPKNKRSVKLKKTSEMDGENKATLQRQNSMSCCSEDESINVPKSRASRGSATDPQSLYARKRREN
ncbi:hypothetical protein K7X08_038076 [Anisodus acutangulus]|uniref:Uncharacterized protein n=1 Tax=Anisodus acutangulus TaxID=402998 RepID=A0A9Q1MXN8_9SOLA|nr:hypothetical protein K7X08_038076 [Anisodus acutangulus]